MNRRQFEMRKEVEKSIQEVKKEENEWRIAESERTGSLIPMVKKYDRRLGDWG